MIKYIYIILLLICGKAYGQISITGSFAAANSPGFGSTLTTSSVTPSSNALLLACVISNKSGGATLPTVSGNGLTWVQVATQQFNTTGSPASRVTIFRAMGASPSAGGITADFGGVNQDRIRIIVSQITGTETSGSNGSNAIVQSVTGGADAATNPTLTLSAISNPANAVVAWFVNGLENTFSTDAGWTNFDNGSNSVNRWYHVYQLNATDNTPSVTGSASDWGAIAVEVNALNSRRIMIIN